MGGENLYKFFLKQKIKGNIYSTNKQALKTTGGGLLFQPQVVNRQCFLLTFDHLDQALSKAFLLLIVIIKYSFADLCNK